MKTKEAVAKRIIELQAGIPPSTIYSMLNDKSGNPGVVTLKKICDGLGLTLVEFFDCELFNSLEQEIE